MFDINKNQLSPISVMEDYYYHYYSIFIYVLKQCHLGKM